MFTWVKLYERNCDLLFYHTRWCCGRLRMMKFNCTNAPMNWRH
jgi:hypothetical protein